MVIEWIFLFMLTLSSSFIVKKRFEDVFNLDADDTFAAEIGEDFYEFRKKFQSRSKDLKTDLEQFNETNLNFNTTNKPTTETIHVGTIPPELSVNKLNISIRQIKLKRLHMQLDHVLNSHRTVSDYIEDSNLDTLTRRVDQIIEKNKVHTKTRREVYYHNEALTYIKYDTKRRLRDLMTHFVYVTRYKLSFVQVLRQKFLSSPVYKIGFLFALARHLKDMQKWLYWPLETNGYDGDQIIGTLFHDLKIIEKLQRLDVDVKDVVLLIQKSEYKGNMESNPKYYDYSMERYF